METFAKNLPITELIAQTDALMVKLGYTKSTMRHFRQAWSALKNHAARRGATTLTMKLGVELLRDHYHIEPFDLNLSSFKQVTRRAVMLLLEYQVSGSIAKHMAMRDHTFPEAFREVGDKYLEWLSVSGSPKPGTVRNHQQTLESAFAFFIAHNVDGVAAVDINLVNAYLKTFAGYSKSYASGRCNHLRRFFEFAHREGYTVSSFAFPEISVYKDRKVPEYYTADETNRLLAAVDRANPRGKRDYAMLLLGARYGLRISDIKALRLDNIDFAKKIISITQVKTDKPLTLHLLPDVGWAIIDYVKNGRPQSDSPEIFVRHVVPYTSFATTDNVAHIIGRYANAAGIYKPLPKKNSFHMLRYGLASELLQKNVSITTISGILGHSELNVTTTYTKINVPQLRACALEVPQ
jgi:site-specific recombinase XerD